MKYGLYFPELCVNSFLLASASASIKVGAMSDFRPRLVQLLLAALTFMAVQSLDSNSENDEATRLLNTFSFNLDEARKYLSYEVNYIRDVPLVRYLWHKSDFKRIWNHSESINLSFAFPFFGYSTRRIHISRHGFISLDDEPMLLGPPGNTSWHIAPYGYYLFERLDVLDYYDSGTSITIKWQGLKSWKLNVNLCTTVSIFKDGTIVFGYHNVVGPVYRSPFWGLRDTYRLNGTGNIRTCNYIDSNHAWILNQTVIHLRPLPTCNQFKSCEDCSKAPTNISCVWCPKLSRCSNGWDRGREEWIYNGCNYLVRSECAGLGTALNVTVQPIYSTDYPVLLAAGVILSLVILFVSLIAGAFINHFAHNNYARFDFGRMFRRQVSKSKLTQRHQKPDILLIQGQMTNREIFLWDTLK